jgi:serine phosphatase RsbU (regulator of sigma subunit)/anti-sigma regulatory factor (Ser/Thr protein kinase)
MKKDRPRASNRQAAIPAKDRPRRVTSMRLIMTLAAVALICVTGGGVGWVAERNARQALTEEIEARLLLEARNLAHLGADALLSEFPELTLCPVISEMQSERPDLAFVVVLDHQNLIQGFADPHELGKEFQLQASFQPEPTRQHLAPGEAFLGTSELLVAAVPVAHANGQILGKVMVGLRLAYLEAKIQHTRKELILFTAGLLAAGIASALVLMSLLLRPIGILRRGLERIGRGDLDTPLELRDRTELGLLADAVNGMAAELKASQAEMIEKERLAHEMNLAYGIQQSFLPEAATAVGDFVVEGSYQAATEVGGDYYDVFPLPDGRLGLVIADVAGKGLSGCLVTSMLAVMIRSLRGKHSSPKALLVALHEGLHGSLQPGVFVTIFYGILDPERGRLVFASAAHSPLLVHRGAQAAVEWYRTGGIPLGIMGGGALAASLEDQSVDLAPGDLALQFTDGLNEAMHAKSREEFGFERIAATVVEHAPRGRTAVMAALHRQVQAWSAPEPPGDDQTLLTISREGVAQAPARKTVTGLLSAQQLASVDELAEMLEGASHLEVAADMPSLAGLKNWLQTCPGLLQLPATELHLVETSLYEICANIVEHGYKGPSAETIDLWWKRLPSRHNGSGLGFFLICDRGRSYDAAAWGPPDLEDPQIRRRGRGLGMHIVHKSMKQVMYLPNTPAGNLTMLRFEPESQIEREELIHA